MDIYATVFPVMAVFGCDYTLWPYFQDTHLIPPFVKKNGTVYDTRGTEVKFFKDIPAVFEKLKKLGIQIAVTSITSDARGAHDLLELFGWHPYISYAQINQLQKPDQFQNLRDESKVVFSDMVFFDDWPQVLRDVKELGVTCISAKGGMTLELLDKGIQAFEDRRS